MFWLLLLAINLFGLSTTADAAPTQIIIVTGDQPNSPFLRVEGEQFDWNKPGITLEVLKRIEQRLAVRFDYQRAPWARCLKMVENNQAQAVFHSSFKSDRAEYGAYPMRDGQLDLSRSLMTLSYVMYSRENTTRLRRNTPIYSKHTDLPESLTESLTSLRWVKNPWKRYEKARQAAQKTEQCRDPLLGFVNINDFQIIPVIPALFEIINREHWRQLSRKFQPSPRDFIPAATAFLQ